MSKLSRLGSFYTHAISLPPGQLMEKLLRRARRELQILRDERRDLHRAKTFSLDSLEKALITGTILENLAENFRTSMRESFFIEPGQRYQIVEFLRSISPQAEGLILADANRVCEHEFNLLGSGTVPLGKEIDWHVDFKSGHHWNSSTYFKRIRPAPYPGGYDIKVPWELSRCQHFSRLGQAYWFTQDERYAREFVEQVTSWIQNNPPQLGVNWSSTMDVAIRAVNWLWGFSYTILSPSITNKFVFSFYETLLTHGRHISNNLERYEFGDRTIKTNHFLSDLVGLIYLGFLLPELKEAAHWRELGLSELEHEMHEQVYADGVSFEASTSYHRLATELFLSATILAQRNGHQFSQSYMTQLEKMLEFIMYITRSDGTIPLIGDQDNGRVHRLSVWEEPDHEWVNLRYLMAIGAVLFDRKDFAQTAGDHWQEAIWMLGNRAIECREKYISHDNSRQSHELTSKAFSAGGIYIMRSGDWHLAIDCGSVGQNGLGSHAHNDSLSIEFFADGINWLVDPGSYVYSADYMARNQFRSTAFHNTVAIDGKEQNRINPKAIFKLTESHPPEVDTWISGDKFDFISATHQGHIQLREPVTHNRQVFFNKKPPKYLLIQDTFMGTGDHLFLWYYQSGPEQVAIVDNSILFTKNGKGMVIFFLEPNPEIQILPGWRSQSYGRKARIPTIKCSMTHSTPFKVRFVLRLVGTETDWFHETEKLAIDAFNMYLFN